jgi:hypothetical protein
MFKGIVIELKNIQALMRTRISLEEAILAELCLKRERDGRRHRKENTKDAATYAAGLQHPGNAGISTGAGDYRGTPTNKPEA